MKQKPSVLVVENYRSLKERFKFILENPPEHVQKKTGVCGFRVDAAATAEEAERLLNQDGADYEAMLLDLKLPKNDDEVQRGLEDEEVGRRLLAIGRQSGIAVVVITGFPSTENLIFALQRGATDFVIKPLTTREDEALLFVRMVKAVGQTRETTFERLRLEHERRMQAIESRRQRDSFAQQTSQRMSQISQLAESLGGLLSRRVGIDSLRDADDPVCRVVRDIRRIANEVHEAGWAGAESAEPSKYLPVSVQSIMRDRLDRIRPCYAYHEVGLDSTCPDPLETSTFPDELRQIIDEVLFETLQLAERGSNVEVHAFESHQPDDIVISVTRHGSAPQEGQNLLERMLNNIGGRLECQPTSDGTCVSIRIPVISHE